MTYIAAFRLLSIRCLFESRERESDRHFACDAGFRHPRAVWCFSSFLVRQVEGSRAVTSLSRVRFRKERKKKTVR